MLIATDNYITVDKLNNRHVGIIYCMALKEENTMRESEKFCRENKPLGVHQYYYYLIHGYDFGIDDYAYISVKRQKLLTHYITFHKLKIYIDCDGEMYINIPESDITNTKHWKNRIYINDFLVTYGAWDNYIDEIEKEQRG